MRRLNLLIILFFILTANLCFAGPIINANPLKAKAYLQVKNLPQGSNAELLIDLTLAEKHHAYDNQFKLAIKSPEFIQLGDFKISPLIEFSDIHSKKVRKSIANNATMTAPFGVPSNAPIGEVNAIVKLTYQACTDEYCLLPKSILVPLQFSITSASDNFGSNSIGNEQADEQKQLTLAEKMQTLGLPTVFFLVFIAGLLTSFTPCVFPMIPITLAVIGNRAHSRSKSQNFFASLSYVLGIAMTYSSLGLFAATTGSLFGSYLGHPVFIGIISSMFLFMGLSMFGFFDLQLPNFITQPLSRIQTGGGFLGAFLSGIIAGVIASPCVGPVLVSVLTYVAQTGNLVIGFWLLFTFAMGLGVLFLVIGTSSSLLKNLPKSGAWMNKVKVIFGVIMIFMAIYFAMPLLKKMTTPSKAATASEQMHFSEFTKEKLQSALDSGRPVIIDFWADWCAACIELERKTFTDAQVKELGQHFTLLKFNATEGSKEFDELQKRYNILGLPNLAFYDSTGKLRTDLTLTGFEKADAFLLRMKKACSPKQPWCK